MSNVFPATARVNSAMLGQFVGQTVRFVGKIRDQNGMKAVLIASDNGQVEVNMHPDSHWGTAFVELIGTVNQDLSISEIASCNLGSDFDMPTYDAAVLMTRRVPDIF